MHHFDNLTCTLNWAAVPFSHADPIPQGPLTDDCAPRICVTPLTVLFGRTLDQCHHTLLQDIGHTDDCLVREAHFLWPELLALASLNQAFSPAR